MTVASQFRQITTYEFVCDRCGKKATIDVEGEPNGQEPDPPEGWATMPSIEPDKTEHAAFHTQRCALGYYRVAVGKAFKTDIKPLAEERTTPPRRRKGSPDPDQPTLLADDTPTQADEVDRFERIAAKAQREEAAQLTEEQASV